MLGTIVNVGAIVLGSLLGFLFRKGIKDKYKAIIIDGLSLCVIIMGIMSTIKTENILLLIGSIVIGSIIGEMLAIEDKLDRLGLNLQKKFAASDADFSTGFITATLVYCIGAMAIVGALEAGLTGNYKTLFAKSILDGVSAIIFTSSLGIGVMFSAIPLFLYQGFITILASNLKDLFTPDMIGEISAVGGILIMAISLNLMGIKKIKVSNMLPSLLIPIIYIVIRRNLVF